MIKLMIWNMCCFLFFYKTYRWTLKKSEKTDVFKKLLSKKLIKYAKQDCNHR